MTVLDQVRRHRATLGDLLATLTETEWDTPSLCEGWRVRDVVAHCVQTHRATPWNLAGDMVLAGFRLDRRNARGVAARRAHTTARLLADFRATAELTRFPRREAPYALMETVIHGYDIAYVLHRRIEVGPDSLALVADTCRTVGPILHGKHRAAGLTLRASDLPWRAGQGPAVVGPIASIILAITGRPATVDDLSGAGLAVLRSRLART